MIKFIRKFFEFENNLAQFKIELINLKEQVNDIKAERDEFKKLLFERVGLVKAEGVVPETSHIEPVNKVMNWRNIKHQREAKARQIAREEHQKVINHWQEKANQAERELQNDRGDEGGEHAIKA